MRLSDVVSALDLTVFPIIGLIAFVSVFLVAGWRAMRTSKEALSHFASMPLDGSECEAQERSGSAGDRS